MKTLVEKEPLKMLMLKVVVRPGLWSISAADMDGLKYRPGENPVRMCLKLDPFDSF